MKDEEPDVLFALVAIIIGGLIIYIGRDMGCSVPTVSCPSTICLRLSAYLGGGILIFYGIVGFLGE